IFALSARDRCCLAHSACEAPSNAKRLEVSPISPRTLKRRTHGWEHVLLHDDPSCVTSLVQRLEQGREVNRTLPQLAEHAVANRRLVIPLLRSCARSNSGFT